jgi:hypothetical protein
MKAAGPTEFVEAGAHDATCGLKLALDQGRMVSAAVCQRLAAKPRKMLLRAAS